MRLFMPEMTQSVAKQAPTVTAVDHAGAIHPNETVSVHQTFAFASLHLKRTLAPVLALPAVLALLMVHANAAAPSENPSSLPPVTHFSAAQAQRDLRVLKRALTELHPGLERRASAAELDTAFAAASAEVAQGASRAQMLWITSRLAASLQCGHTWTNPLNQSPAVTTELLDRADKLPLTLRLVQGRFLVTGSTAPGIAAGAELLAVQGNPVAHILQTLLPALRADGASEGSDGKRWSQLNTGPNGGAMDRLFPLRFPPGAEGWRLRVQDAPGTAPRDVLAAPTSVAARNRALAAPSSEPGAWTFSVQGDTAVLTLPTFSFWRSSFDAKGFLQRSFDTLRQQATPYLVIDIRNNEGGDDELGRAVLAQLLKTSHTVPPYRVESAYERAPYALARYLETWDFSFFDRTGQVTHGSGRNWRLADKPAVTTQAVSAPYAGRVLLLVGPQNSSAGFLLARDVQRSGAALLLGQATGGSLRGLNGGQLAWVTLPESGVSVDIPLLAAFASGEEPDRGVLPDLPVAPSWADAASGLDTEMQAAQRIIATWRAEKARAK
jgi:hypothetical protein